MRFVIAIGNLLSDIWHNFSRVMAMKLRWMLVGFGLVFAWFSVPHVVMPIVAEVNYQPAVATVTYAGWACSDGAVRMRWCPKSEVDARHAAKSKLRTTYFVVFTYAGADGKVHRQDWPIHMTGLRERVAVPGYQFSILFDPAQPRRVSMRFGSDLRNTLISAGSLLSIFLGVSWWVAAYRRRREREAKGAIAQATGPVFTRDGQRIRPLPQSAAFGKRIQTRA